MLKRVPTGSLRLGMYIHTPEGSWLDYPGWRTKFLLADQAELESMQQSAVTAFVIDTSKGFDAELAAAPARTRAPAPAAAQPAPRPSIRRPDAPQPPQAANNSSAEEEFGRAAAVVQQAGKTIEQILNQARLGKAVDIGRTLPVIEGISQSIDRNSSALVSYVRMKTTDEYTYLHSVAVCALMINLGRQLLFDDDELAELGTAGLLHDIGKVAMPQELLRKPSSLTPAEMAQIREHPRRGFEMLSRSKGVSDMALDVCLHHHERIDGRGYPDRLRGDSISLHARMAAVCDVYDAVTSRRVYKGPEQPGEALAEMFGTDGHFDSEVLAAFVRSVGIYPIGSLVRLKSSRLAIVIEQNPVNLTRPEVRIFYSIGGRARVPYQDIDLGDGDDEILSRERPEKWGLAPWDATWSQMLRGDMGRQSAA